MNGALIVTWGSNVPGREAKGLEVFGKALAHFDELAKKGRIHGHIGIWRWRPFTMGRGRRGTRRAHDRSLARMSIGRNTDGEAPRRFTRR